MAGTPTQYYGFPTYADSDAVDLTAQYNTAVTNIDSELHKLDLRLDEVKKPLMLVLGDSWTDDTNTANSGYKVVQAIKTYLPGTDVVSYGKGSARWSTGLPTNNVTLQVEKAHAAGIVPDYVVAICGVNDYHNVDANADLTIRGLDEVRTAIATYWPSASYFPFMDCSLYTAGNSVGTTFFNKLAYFTNMTDYLLLDVVMGMYGTAGMFDSSGYHPNQSGANAIGMVVCNRVMTGSVCKNIIVTTGVRAKYTSQKLQLMVNATQDITLADEPGNSLIRFFNFCGYAGTYSAGNGTKTVTLENNVVHVTGEGSSCVVCPAIFL